MGKDMCIFLSSPSLLSPRKRVKTFSPSSPSSLDESFARAFLKQHLQVVRSLLLCLLFFAAAFLPTAGSNLCTEEEKRKEKARDAVEREKSPHKTGVNSLSLSFSYGKVRDESFHYHK